MPYKVRIIRGTPEYDALPVAKVADYPLEKRDYRPFAQNVLCVGTDMLFLRMWAFEVSPAAESGMRGVFYIFPERPGTALHVSVRNADEISPEPLCEAFIFQNGERICDIPLRGVRPHSGEDLQGVYWGASISIALGDLQKAAGRVLCIPSDKFMGNFYKICPDKGQEHYGSFYPANFCGDPYGYASMGGFEVVDY